MAELTFKERVLRWLIEVVKRPISSNLHDLADDDLALFRTAVTYFAGPSYRLPLRITGAVWVGRFTAGVHYRWRVLLGVALCIVETAAVSLPTLGPEGGWSSLAVWDGDQGGDFWRVFGKGGGPFDAILFVMQLLAITAGWLLVLGSAALSVPRRPTGLSKGHWARLNRVPYLCARLIVCCADASGSANRPRQRHRRSPLKDTDTAVAILSQELMRLPRDSRLFRPRSRRSKAARHHVGLVVAALHRVSIRLDSEPETATRELADMALRICSAYVGHRWGRLLEESELAGLEPVRSREPLRLALAGLFTVAVAVAAALLGVPDGALPIVIGLAGLMSFGRTPRALELLDSFRGVQRP